MKIKLLIAFLALVGFAAGASAQDPGAPDSVIVTFGHTPDVAAGDSMVVVVVHFAVHDDAVRSISTGYGWDFEGFEMDSAKWTAQGAAAFPGFPLVWSNTSSSTDTDSTNFYNRFQVTGFGFGMADLVTSADICTFYGHVNTWTDGDVINITPNSFVTMAFVTSTNLEFAPTWGGDATIADVNAMNLGTLPTKFDLAQNYPNPFNPKTVIPFDLPQRAHANLAIYNVLGQTVTTLVDEDLAADRYEVEWDGTADGGHQVASGIYFYRLTAGEQVMTKKMMLLK